MTTSVTWDKSSLKKDTRCHWTWMKKGRHMGKGGLSNMEERTGVQGKEPSMECSQKSVPLELLDDLTLTKRSKTPPDLWVSEEKNLNLSDPQDSDSAEWEDDRSISRTSSVDNENEPEDIESQGNSNSSLYGSVQQDHQLDMTEDERCRASRDSLEPQRSECPSRGCSRLHKRQFSSNYNISPTGLGEPQGGFERSHYDQDEDRLSGQSDISLYPTNTPIGHNLSPGSVGSADSIPESIGQFGDSMEYPSESEGTSSLDDVHPRICPTETSPSHSLSPLSPEGLQHSPIADGKMNSDASYQERPDRYAGAVPQTGPVASQDCSDFKAQIPHNPSYKFGRGESNSPIQLEGIQPVDQIQKSKKNSAVLLRSQCSGSFCPLNPLKSSSPKKLNQSKVSKQGANMPVHSSSEVSRYGRGQLNYPLPDFSKVEAKVRFPKDEESYRPPKGRNRSRQFPGSTRPLVFKSPAEIVREVLLSSGDGSSQKTSLPSYTVAKVPEEFKTPQQATELVQQLQEDYHKLLTKYAEAENTIDQLRLGAKVHLYSDPPKPSHGVQMGTMPHGTKVLSFTIPQARMAEWQSMTNSSSQALLDPELSATQGDLILSPVASYPIPLTDGSSSPTPGASLGDRLTQKVANDVAKFLAQVESFEGLVQKGRLVPQDQLKGFWKLKEEQDALEKAFLWARGEHRRVQQLQASEVPPGEFDPNREVEGEIFRLGMRLEELMDEINDLRPGQPSLITPPEKSHGSLVASPVSDLPALSPAPSTQAPMPTVRTPYPETPAIQNGHHFLCEVDAGVSSACTESEEESPRLPESLQFKQQQMEQDFHRLMVQYHNMKSFPDTVKLEEDEEEKDSTQEEKDSIQEEKDSTQEEKNSTQKVDGPVSGNPKAFEPTPRRIKQEELTHPNPLEKSVEQTGSAQPPELPSSLSNGGHQLGGLLQSPMAQPHPCTTKLTPPIIEQKQFPSQQSSNTSLAGSAVSDSLPLQKPFHSASAPQLARNFDMGQYKEHRIVSPETDSGFVGSETSRVSPLTQSSEHRLSHTSMSFGASNQRRLPQSSSTYLSQAPSSYHLGRDRLVTGVPSGLSTSGAQSQRSNPAPTTPLKKCTKSFCLKPGPSTKMADLDGEGCEKTPEPYPHGKEDGQIPASTTSDEAYRETAQDPLSNFISREMRDQAIRALQQEVTRLRERIEACLNPPPDNSSNNFQQSTRARSRLAKDSLLVGGSPHTSKSAERYQGDRGDTIQNNSTVRLKMRSSSLPREGTQLAQVSTSEHSASSIQAEEQSPPDIVRRGTRGKRTDTALFRGQYTGHEYRITSSQPVPEDDNSRYCPCCHSMRKQLPDNTLSKHPEEFFTRDSLKKTQCTMCHRPRSPAEKDRESSGIDKSTQKGAPLSSGPIRKPEQQQEQATPSLSRPSGVWYLSPPLSTPAGATIAYVPSVPVMPYSPSALYFSPAAPTSASSPLRYSGGTSGKKPTEMRPLSQGRRISAPPSGHCCSSDLDVLDLDDLSRSLSRAVEAAKNVELTTKQMTRSLSADLHRARGLRGSCLF